MRKWICVTCGVQHAAEQVLPDGCAICEDERQWVRHEGQAWTTLEDLQKSHHNVINELEQGLHEILTVPKVGIGQRALLVQTPAGNVLWDCLSLVDQATISAIEALGGISGLAMSHPHMFGSMVAWSHAFGGSPIHLHASFEKWVQRPDPAIEYWDGGRYALNASVTLHRCGGHFTGSTVLHWPAGAEGRGVLLTSDTLHVTPDRKHVTFMYSYPNYIPLSARVVESIAQKVAPLAFDRLYSHFAGLVIEKDSKEVIQRSVDRYKQAIRS